MIQKILIVGLAIVMVAGFAVGVFALGRDVIWGTESNQVQALGNGNGRTQTSDTNQGGGRGREQALGGQVQTEHDDCNTATETRGGRGNVASDTNERIGSTGRNGQSQGSGAGGNNAQEPISRNPDWREVTGTVIAFDGEMTIDTDQGEVLVGMGQSSYVETQRFTAKAGDQVVVWGFDEDGEFKAGEVQNLTTGEQITLRDQDGRPMWAGQGNRQNQS